MAGCVFGPIMGYNIGIARFARKPAGRRLRVMTYNVKWGARDARGVLANIASADPDLVLMQHSMGVLNGPLASLKRSGWTNLRLGQYTVLSRYPLSDAASVWLTPDRRYECLRCSVRFGARTVTLYDVHLMTPRWALNAVADRGADGVGDLQENAQMRAREAAAVAADIRSRQGPFIVAGDLNAPVQSRACRTLLQTGLRDAYSEAGWGYGYTYGQSTPVGRPYVRIDHILASPEWAVLRCREGSARGSDHSPVTADLLLPNTPGGTQ
jgi:endonuclease/exonuclease/phosphatase (EEP) superfamily protein YafD